MHLSVKNKYAKTKYVPYTSFLYFDDGNEINNQHSDALFSYIFFPLLISSVYKRIIIIVSHICRDDGRANVWYRVAVV